MELRERLAAYAWLSGGDWQKTARLIRDRAETVLNVTEPYITILDDAYPAELKELRYPPWVLFYRGDPRLLGMKGIAVIGSRDADEYGIALTEHIVTTIGKERVFVSGLAKGIDAAVHRTAIRTGAHTIGVVGHGLDTVYPPGNRDLYGLMRNDQLIISEYPGYTGVRKYHFPWRNRIIAALGAQLIVVQAALKSGTMITVNEALGLSRDVYCVPYRFGEDRGKGCDLLIGQGAQILFEDEQLKALAK